MLNVQFADSTESVVVGYFGAPQDPQTWPNVGTVDVTDARWKTYYDAQPKAVQAYLPSPV